MNTYIILLRGVNVGGKSKLPMGELRQQLENAGFSNVTTYIASGNIILDTPLSAGATQTAIQSLLRDTFELNNLSAKALVLTLTEFRAVVQQAPTGFGQAPGMYYSDVIFTIDTTAAGLTPVFETRPDVDTVWQGPGVAYFQRLSAKRTKSRLGKIMTKPFYQNLTIRNWNTVTKLLALAEARTAL